MKKNLLAAMRAFFCRLVRGTNRRKLRGSLDNELKFHIEMETENNIRQGMSVTEARRSALIALGGIDSLKETYCETGSIGWMESFARDMRHGFRMLMRQPLQSLIITGVLALGMAGTMTGFNLINAVFLRPLPFEDPSRIMILSEVDSAGGNDKAVPYYHFYAWRRYNRSFEAIAYSSQFRTNISHNGAAENAYVRIVTPEFFDVLEIRPVMGRTFTEEDSRPGPQPVLLGEGLWKRMFDSDPAILGRTILLNGSPSGPVVGILPDTTFPDRKGVWLPSTDSPDSTGGLGPMTVGRLKKGVTIEKARTDLARVLNNWAVEHPDRNDSVLPRVVPLRDSILGTMGDDRFMLFVAFAVAGLVLVIACCNVVGIMLARSTYQKRELAIRLSLGATRGHIMRQVLAESLVLAVSGSVPGVLLGWYALQGLLRFLGDEVPNWMRFEPDIRCILFGILLVAGTTLFCGLLPALFAAGPRDLRGILQTSYARTAGSRKKHRAMGAIIAAQVALSMTLLVGAGLLLQTYLKVQFIDPGFSTNGILTYRVPLSITAYLDENRRHAFWEQHIEKVRALPGVEEAALVSALPLSFPEIGMFESDSGPNTINKTNPQVFIRRITPGYFKTLGIPLLAGQVFVDRDNRRNSERTAIIDRRFADQFWPGENPIGRRIRMIVSQHAIGGLTRGSQEWIRIIGMVRDTHQLSLDEVRLPGLYLPRATNASFDMYAVVHTTGNPTALVPAIRKSVQSLDKSVPVDEIVTLEKHVHKSMLSRRLALWIYGILALVAVCLTFVGIYGITSYMVGQRTQEIGIRVALGARKTEVMRLVIGHSLRLVLIGLIPGFLGALALGRILASVQSMLYGVSSADPLTLICVPLILASAAVFASSSSAYKAMQINPMSALRSE